MPTGSIVLRGDWQHTDGKAHTRLADSWDATEGVHRFAMLSWDTSTLSWIRFSPSVGGGGGAGDASAANQLLGNVSLASIDTKTPALVGGRQPVDGSGVTQPVSAIALPLPAGAATSALQGTGNTSVANLDTTTGAKADAAWDLAAAAPSSISIWKKAAGLLDAIRVSLAGTLAITGNVGITGTPQVDVTDEAGRVLGVATLGAGTAAIGKVLCAEPGRANVSIYAEAVAGIIAETLVSLIKSTQFGVAAAGATSIGPTAGKNLRIYAMVISWVSTAATANTCRIRLRALPVAPALIGSPIAYTARIAWESATFIANEGEFQFIPLDIDIPSGGAIAATVACAAANGTLDLQLLAYEYTP